jgi:glycine betaine/proline transport system permease protein
MTDRNRGSPGCRRIGHRGRPRTLDASIAEFAGPAGDYYARASTASTNPPGWPAPSTRLRRCSVRSGRRHGASGACSGVSCSSRSSPGFRSAAAGGAIPAPTCSSARRNSATRRTVSRTRRSGARRGGRGSDPLRETRRQHRRRRRQQLAKAVAANAEAAEILIWGLVLLLVFKLVQGFYANAVYEKQYSVGASTRLSPESGRRPKRRSRRGPGFADRAADHLQVHRRQPLGDAQSPSRRSRSPPASSRTTGRLSSPNSPGGWKTVSTPRRSPARARSTASCRGAHGARRPQPGADRNALAGRHGGDLRRRLALGRAAGGRLHRRRARLHRVSRLLGNRDGNGGARRRGGGLCVVIGIPLGIWFGKSRRAYNAAEPVLDLMQTLPAFVYLIPIMWSPAPWAGRPARRDVGEELHRPVGGAHAAVDAQHRVAGRPFPVGAHRLQQVAGLEADAFERGAGEFGRAGVAGQAEDRAAAVGSQ